MPVELTQLLFPPVWKICLEYLNILEFNEEWLTKLDPITHIIMRLLRFDVYCYNSAHGHVAGAFASYWSYNDGKTCAQIQFGFYHKICQWAESTTCSLSNYNDVKTAWSSLPHDKLTVYDHDRCTNTTYVRCTHIREPEREVFLRDLISLEVTKHIAKTHLHRIELDTHIIDKRMIEHMLLTEPGQYSQEFCTRTGVLTKHLDKTHT